MVGFAEEHGPLYYASQLIGRALGTSEFAGRLLPAIFGIATIAQDRFLRTVGFRRAAHAAWQTLPEEAKRQVNAYVAGVNAFLSTHHGSALPPEFAILRFEPEPWMPDDVIVWVKMMAWDLSANYSFELLRHDLIARVFKCAHWRKPSKRYSGQAGDEDLALPVSPGPGRHCGLPRGAATEQSSGPPTRLKMAFREQGCCLPND